MKSTSIDITRLWIGDPVIILDSGLEGTFHGIGLDEKIKVKVNDHILLVSKNNLSIKEEAHDENDLEDFSDIEDHNPKAPIAVKSYGKEIDLHIEKLNPEIQNAHPQIILDHQLQMCQSFVKDVISKRRNVVTIIHGRGTGVLKEEVLHLLKEFKNVRFCIEVNNGGAQEVWMRY